MADVIVCLINTPTDYLCVSILLDIFLLLIAARLKSTHKPRPEIKFKINTNIVVHRFWTRIRLTHSTPHSLRLVSISLTIHKTSRRVLVDDIIEQDRILQFGNLDSTVYVEGRSNTWMVRHGFCLQLLVVRRSMASEYGIPSPSLAARKERHTPCSPYRWPFPLVVLLGPVSEFGCHDGLRAKNSEFPRNMEEARLRFVVSTCSWCMYITG